MTRTITAEMLVERGTIKIHKRGGGIWLKVSEMSAYIENRDGEAAA